MICGKLKPAVRGLEETFPGKVKARNIPADEPEARDAVREFGFKSHGLVIRSAGGAALWHQADHTVNIQDVEAELRRILGA